MSNNVYPMVPSRVMLTIQAKSKPAALEFARTIKNFQVDEGTDVIALPNDFYIVFGTAIGPIEVRQDLFADVKGLTEELSSTVLLAIRKAYENGDVTLS